MRSEMSNLSTKAPTSNCYQTDVDFSRSGLRLAFINTHPIQYFAPMYAYFQHNCEMSVTALYLSDFSLRNGLDKGFNQAVTWDLDLLAGYEARFIGRVRNRRIGGFFSVTGTGLWSVIRSGRYDAVVIHGHNLAAHHVALAACKTSGTPAFARSETHLRLSRPPWKEAVRRPLISWLYTTFDGFLAIGSANARYYRSLGVPSEKIFSMPYAVDNARFTTASRISPTKRAGLRAQLGVTNDAPIILYAGKFDRRKRPNDLLEAFAKLQRDNVDANLVLVGSGVLEPELRSAVERNLIRNVSFPGFINQTNLPMVYAACDVFVLPSDNEPWGLAVNEAMCCGMPVVVSEEIGCAEDLVDPGINGARFAAGDVNGLAAALVPFLRDPNLRARSGAFSRARIETWGYAECARGLRAAVIAARVRRGLKNETA